MQKQITLLPLALIVLTLACSATATQAAQTLPAVVVASPAPQTDPSPYPSPSLITPALTICIVTAEALNIRTCPAVACPVVGWLRRGQAVSVAGVVSGWADLAAGWVNTNYMTCEEAGRE